MFSKILVLTCCVNVVHVSECFHSRFRPKRHLFASPIEVLWNRVYLQSVISILLFIYAITMLRNITKLNLSRSIIGISQRNISTSPRLSAIFKIQVAILKLNKSIRTESGNISEIKNIAFD